MPEPGTDAALESAVRSVLDALGAEYEWMPCDPDFADTAAFCERYGVSPDISANTIVVASRRGPQAYCACVVLATTRLDVNNTVRRMMGVPKASFASAEETVELTGMRIGGVTPYGLPDGMPLYVDAGVMERDEVVTGAGSRSAKVRLRPGVLQRLPNATVVQGLATPRQ
ncbi:MAG TPA: YbaK/EbsC family protein [Candidatus Dormibacteraeota bacterium]|jgi:prolyl-tRNA editing enzyme YbaK/EbsC (Cys-tRNA(Pro) deacylase)|nr:YbaK/EbsC family protein [Candidatus Dormibacteraeota bacterium]